MTWTSDASFQNNLFKTSMKSSAINKLKDDLPARSKMHLEYAEAWKLCHHTERCIPGMAVIVKKQLTNTEMTAFEEAQGKLYADSIMPPLIITLRIFICRKKLLVVARCLRWVLEVYTGSHQLKRNQWKTKEQERWFDSLGALQAKHSLQVLHTMWPPATPHLPDNNLKERKAH